MAVNPVNDTSEAGEHTALFTRSGIRGENDQRHA